MAYKWPNLDPNEIQDYSVDWSRFLNTGDTISIVQWFINDEELGSYEMYSGDSGGLTVVQPTNTTTVATLRLTGGVVGKRYLVKCRVTTAEGLRYNRTIYLTITEK
jgi:hypothetical protein